MATDNEDEQQKAKAERRRKAKEAKAERRRLAKEKRLIERQLVEQHVISRTHPRFAVIDAAAFASKNLYNASLYEIRQSFIKEHSYLPYAEMSKRMQSHEAYKALPAKVAQ